MAIIEVKNLVKIYDNRRVLDGINLKIEKGETMVIMGGSGCGKSTLLKILIGQLKPADGEVYIDGDEITHMTDSELDVVRRKFGMLYQGGALLNSLTLAENVALPLKEHTKLDKHIIEIIVKMKLAQVGLVGFENKMPAEMSGGMKKRAALARAIALDPHIVFYDEPGAGLDPIVAAVIDKLIMDLSKKLGMTSVVVTHEMKSAFRIADKMAVLFKGKVIELGTPEQIKNSNNPYVQQFVTGSLEATSISAKDSTEEYIKSLVEGM
ncbi:MAG: ABC transporter ATP-binding protein [Candidatus Auribacterota bacterium]|nr:ABC transporter ATP-binding protein [Candidatus Auribacterota bacterium]